MAFFLGGVGGHKFYLGQTGLGVVYLLFCWTFIPAIAAFFEFFLIISMSEQEFNARFNYWAQPGMPQQQQSPTTVIVQTQAQPQQAPTPEPSAVPTPAPSAPSITSVPTVNEAVPSGSLCPACGSPLKPGAKFCVKCGTHISQPEAVPAKLVCAKCGAEMHPGAKFCNNCGTPVGVASIPAVHDDDGPHEHRVHYHCPKCHHELEAGATQCPGCGVRLKPREA